MQFKKTLLRYGWSKSRDVGATAWKSFESIAFIERPRTADMVWPGLDRLFRGWKQRLYMRRCICLVYINNNLYLARKYARIFVRGHYLFREANSFARAKLEENCELRGTDNVQGQISEHIFATKLRLLCLSSIGFKNWGISSNIPQF